jgi:small conductance mechanosensitive channel
MISNGDVRLVTNASRDWSLAIVDLNLPLDADFLRVIRLLQEAVERAAQDETLQADLIELPKVAGWSNLTDWSVQARLSAKTRPSGRLAVETALRREALQALHNAGVQLAIPPRM